MKEWLDVPAIVVAGSILDEAQTTRLRALLQNEKITLSLLRSETLSSSLLENIIRDRKPAIIIAEPDILVKKARATCFAFLVHRPYLISVNASNDSLGALADCPHLQLVLPVESVDRMITKALFLIGVADSGYPHAA